MVQLNEEKAVLAAKIKASRKAMKIRKIVLRKLDYRVKMLAWTPQEQKADFETDVLYGQALHMPVGDLLDLFEPREGEGDIDADHRKWFNVGRQHGLAGFGWPDEPPKHCDPEFHRDYAEGQDDGEKELHRSIQSRVGIAVPEAPTVPPPVDEPKPDFDKLNYQDDLEITETL
jgi:hypothetical protein